MVVFNSSLNKFGRKYLIKNQCEDERELLLTWKTEYQKSLGNFIEQLLFFDKVSIKVYGENLTLAILINELGIKQLEELLEEDAIEFILWTPVLTTMEGEQYVGKLMPLQSGNLHSPTHAIPEESIKQGFDRLKIALNRTTLRKLMRTLVGAYRVPRESFAHDAATIVMGAYTKGKLSSCGLNNDKDVKWLNYEERMKLSRLGEEILETGLLAEYQYSSFGSYQYYDISRQSFDAIRSAPTALKGVHEILRTERLPNIPQLIAQNQISLKDIVKLRRKDTSIKFRKWLIENFSESDGYVSKKYIEEIANHKGVLETAQGKFIKTVGMYGIGGLIGSLVAGVPGTIAGTAAGAILQPISDIGLDLLDTYMLESLLKGWQPRLFINEYEKVLQEKSNVHQIL